MTRIDVFLNRLIRKGRLLEIDVAFAEFVARLAGAPDDPALTLLAALVSNAFSQHNEIALPAARIAGSEALGAYLGEKQSDLPVDGEFRLPEVNRYPLIFSDGRAGITPLVLADGLLYLGRSLQAQLFLRDYVAAHSGPLTPRAFDRTVTMLAMNEEQYRAAAQAANADFAVISGGPGTGKTTIAAVILALRAEDPREVMLCAPTGKAQMRLSESLNSQLQSLRLPPEKIAALGKIAAMTIHRLLGINPAKGSARYHRGNPLPYKLLIVDECSMIPLFLMKRLLEAVRPDASVILLGDRHQLASVEPGSVFGDFCDLLKKSAPDHLAELTVSYRFREGGGIAVLRDCINASRAEEAWDFLVSGRGEPEVAAAKLPVSLRELEELVRRCAASSWFAGGRPYLAEETLERAWAGFEAFRILTAVNGGPLGTRKLNEFAAGLLGLPGDGRPAPGGAVMILANDVRTGLFNGTVGMFWYADDGGKPLSREEAARLRTSRLLAFFPESDDAGQPVWRGVPEDLLPEHTYAYAFTIHKAQGSDYGTVLLLLADSGAAMRPLLTREVLYTGLTRARERAVIAAEKDLFCAAVCRVAERISGLKGAEFAALTPEPAGAELKKNSSENP